MVLSIYNYVVVDHRISGGLDPFQQEAVLLEDAVGYVLRIDLDTIRSWEVSIYHDSVIGLVSNRYQTLHMILYDKFSKSPGHEMVKRRQYAVLDDLSGRELRRILPFGSAVRPGQKINMSMIFYSHKEAESFCPRCKTVTAANKDEEVEW